jgi:hypothetical protein
MIQISCGQCLPYHTYFMPDPEGIRIEKIKAKPDSQAVKLWEFVRNWQQTNLNRRSPAAE